MIERDFVLRHVRLLADALALVLLRRRAGEDAAARHALTDAVQQATGQPLGTLCTLDRAALLAALPTPILAAPLAALLAEAGDQAARQRAAWLYEHALRAGAAVPLDVHARLAALRADPAGSARPTSARRR